MKSKIFIALYGLFCFVAVTLMRDSWKDHLFMYDRSGYHLYLPAAVIYNDLGRLTFFSKINYNYYPGGQYMWDWYEIFDQPTGKRLNKYPIGVSVMELPFFIAAHTYAVIAKDYPTDGYSLPYQYGGIISNLFWVLVGLAYLRGYLKRHYNDTIIFITLLGIALGTNIYFYIVYEPCMSHTYSFCLFAATIYYAEEWYRSGRSFSLFMLAILIGLITIVRPVNILFAIVPLLWRVGNTLDMRQRLIFYYHKWKSLVIAAIIFCLILFIQLSYWKYVTGKWIFYAYGKESFLWDEPRVLDGLFGFRKGWFIYSPIVFLAALGFIPLWKRDKKIVPAILVFFSGYIYVTFCWWSWWYGGGFGARCLIETLPVMAIPLAALLQSLWSAKLKAPIFLIGVLIFLFCALNIFQCYQARKNIIHHDRMTFRYYWRVFCRPYVEEKDFELLMDDKTYWKEMGRIDKK
ncbi:MAG: hypothetical protein EOP56_13790 [Sphingobacteriales bacterium]|nr:MAG: hypothetical protein EOP56_13790 [Sphingobacteriales bacterium]